MSNDPSVKIQGVVTSAIGVGLLAWAMYLLGTIGTGWSLAGALIVLVGIGFILYKIIMNSAEAGMKLAIKMEGKDESFW